MDLAIAAIEVAKNKPMAAVFDYFGEQLHESFFITPDERGVDEICRIASETAAKAGKKHLVYSLEHTGHYHEHIAEALRKHGCVLMPLNSFTTKRERDSMLDYSKTDDLDLHSIAEAVSAGKTVEDRVPTGSEAELRFMARTRRSLIKDRSRAFIALRTLLDHYWPALQGVPEVIGGKPVLHRIFGKTWTDQAFEFLRHVNTPAEARSLGESGLEQLSRQQRLRLGKRRIALILQAAALAPETGESLLELYRVRLKEILDAIANLNKRIGEFERRSQAILAGSRSVLLLTMPQIGAVTAAEYMGEVGFQVPRLHSASAIVKLAGTNPVPDESGDHSYGTRISKQGGSFLRALTFTMGRNLSGPRGNPYFVTYGQRLKLKPKQRWIAVGNKAHHVMFAMLKKGEIFAPQTWPGPFLADNPLKKLLPEFRDLARRQLRNLGINRY
ncbi:MAG: IS110 family transposase [Bacteroidota bacterium]